MCYENPKNKITAVPANEEEIWGATFKVTKCNLGFPSCDVMVCSESLELVNYQYCKLGKIKLGTSVDKFSKSLPVT